MAVHFSGTCKKHAAAHWRLLTHFAGHVFLNRKSALGSGIFFEVQDLHLIYPPYFDMRSIQQTCVGK